MNSPLESPLSSRREMLAGVGQGAAALALLSLQSVAAAQPSSQEGGARKLGLAIVGIGRLSINQLLPAFERCKHAKLAALVSGDPVKVKKFAAQYGVAAKHIYDYSSFDNIAHDDAIDVVYIV